MELLPLCVVLMCVSSAVCASYNASDPGHPKVLSRKKRFLLFPPGSNILLTAFFGKGLVFRGPQGYVVIGELDLYYPLPDYKYQASALKLGKIAMYPPEPPKSPPPTPPPSTPPPPQPEHDHDHDHHAGGELTPEEVDQYLKEHPGSWVPPGWGNDRADWNGPNLQYSSPYWAPERMDSGMPPYQYAPSRTLDRYLGAAGRGDGDNHGWSARPGARYRRSVVEQALADDRKDEEERERWLSGEAFNISHHSDWEHFHHYRDRRALFSHLEDTIGAITGLEMKECILRSICEAKNMLPPPGRSMSMDIFRLLFSYPLDEVLNDDYSNVMRDDNVDCRARYGKGCPVSLLDLVLFGKFES